MECWWRNKKFSFTVFLILFLFKRLNIFIFRVRRQLEEKRTSSRGPTPDEESKGPKLRIQLFVE